MYLSFLLLRRSLRSIHSRRNLRTDFLRGSSGGTLFKAPLRADRIGSKGQGGHAKGHGATKGGREGREGGREGGMIEFRGGETLLEASQSADRIGSKGQGGHA